MKQQILHFSSIPRQGLRYVRVHYLFELVGVSYSGEAPGLYDWSKLDQAMDLLVHSHMTPIFELMGNPSGAFTSFRDDLQLNRWQALVFDLANHLIDRFGKEEVETWYFESWNEPDAGWWHEFPQDEEAFCNYYDACATGIKKANPNLKIGGPGTCRTLSPLFKKFLAHCDSGNDHFSNEPKVPLDFISIHEKAAPARKEDITPQTVKMLECEKEIIKYIRSHHPRFSNIPFMNNECDPQVGWRDFHSWHAKPYYAAWIVNSVYQHLDQIIDGMHVNYTLLGNDHGFIGEWGNRTLLTRFGSSSWFEDGQSKHMELESWRQTDFSTPGFSMVKKPAFNAMAFLSLLGPQRLFVETPSPQVRVPNGYELNIIATREGDNLIILLYFSCDRIFTSDRAKVEIEIMNLPVEMLDFTHYRIDESHGNPFELWDIEGAPKVPDYELLTRLRMAQENILISARKRVKTTSNKIRLNFTIPLHAVSLIILSNSFSSTTNPLTEILCHEFTDVFGYPDYQITWDHVSSPGSIRYEVEYAASINEPFTRLKHSPLLTASIMVNRAGYYHVNGISPSGLITNLTTNFHLLV